MVFRLAGAAGAAGEACTREVQRVFSGERVPPPAARRGPARSAAAGDRAGALRQTRQFTGDTPQPPRRERHARRVPGERANGAVSGAAGGERARGGSRLREPRHARSRRITRDRARPTT